MSALRHRDEAQPPPRLRSEAAGARGAAGGGMWRAVLQGGLLSQGRQGTVRLGTGEPVTQEARRQLSLALS